MTHLKAWVDHCKKYAAANGKKYSECLKDDNCKKMYHSTADLLFYFLGFSCFASGELSSDSLVW